MDTFHEKTSHEINLDIKKKLAQAYHILAHLKLDDHTYTHLSSRTEDTNSFFIYPFGMRFEEVQAEHLLTVSLTGDILKGSEQQYNKTGYIIHGQIYQKRPDIKHIFHIHTHEVVAVSAIAEGLLPLSQWALHFYNRVSYHDYNSLALNKQQGHQLAEDLGSNYTLLLRNHGAVICGRTIEETMFYTYHLQQACKAQCFAMALQRPLIIPSKQICEETVNDLLCFEKNLGERDWLAWTRFIERQNNFTNQNILKTCIE